MLSFVEREGATAATSRCRMTGPRRTKPVEWTIDHAFPRLSAPILPGFNTSVRRTAFESVGGFPDVPNEDTAFSRALGRSGPTGYCTATLVENSGRRIATSGRSGTLYHCLILPAVTTCKSIRGTRQQPFDRSRFTAPRFEIGTAGSIRLDLGRLQRSGRWPTLTDADAD